MDSKTGLILFSHGSVLAGAGQTLHEHAERIRASGKYAAVEVGFMNYSEPTFAEAVARCAEAGCTRIVVTPYFLFQGYFVSTGMPKHVQSARTSHPEVEFVCAGPIGFDESLEQAIMELAAPVDSETALLLMAHGSPTPAANDDLFKVAVRIHDLRRFHEVEVGFLECNQPTIAEALDSLVAGGASQIVAVPYFLHTGKHVANDIPAILDEARVRHPSVRIELTEYIGRSPRIGALLAKRAAEAMR